MLHDQHFEFLGDTLLATTHVGPGEPDNLCYAFPVAYWNVKASGYEHAQHFPKQFVHCCTQLFELLISWHFPQFVHHCT
jgi:hypothetical protein